MGFREDTVQTAHGAARYGRSVTACPYGREDLLRTA